MMWSKSSLFATYAKTLSGIFRVTPELWLRIKAENKRCQVAVGGGENANRTTPKKGTRVPPVR